NAVQVHVDDPVPGVPRHLMEHSVTGDSGVIDEDFDASEFGLDFSERPGAVRRIGHIALQYQDAISIPTDIRSGCIIAVGRNYGKSVLDQPFNNSPPDPPRSAGY